MSDHPSNGWEQPKQAGCEFRVIPWTHPFSASHARLLGPRGGAGKGSFGERAVIIEDGNYYNRFRVQGLGYT